MTTSYRRLHVLVEGQTEENVHRDLLQPYFESLGWSVSHSLIKTKRTAVGSDFGGGITSWNQVERDVRLLLGDTSLTVLTTLFDYYAFPADSPGMSTRPISDPYESVAHVEKAIAARFNDSRFRPHLVLHELEAWVFAAADQLAELLGDEVGDKLKHDVAVAGGAELVNDAPETAPSKRLLRYSPGYSKTLDGPLALIGCGLPKLRAMCPRLDGWLASFD